MNKIEENRVAKEEISGCHKKCKTGQRKRKYVAVIKKDKIGQRTKSKRNGQKQG